MITGNKVSVTFLSVLFLFLFFSSSSFFLLPVFSFFLLPLLFSVFPFVSFFRICLFPFCLSDFWMVKRLFLPKFLEESYSDNFITAYLHSLHLKSRIVVPLLYKIILTSQMALSLFMCAYVHIFFHFIFFIRFLQSNFVLLPPERKQLCQSCYPA